MLKAHETGTTDASTASAPKLALPAGWTPVHEARLQLCRFLALAASDPRSARFGRLLHEDVLEAAEAAATFLASRPEVRPPELAPGERSPATLDVSPLVAALRSTRASLNAEYEQVFGLVASKECPAYETDYCPQTFSVYRSQQLADIAGCYSAFGLVPSRDMPERHDHVSLELEFLAWLLAKERHALRAEREAADAAAAQEQAAICRDAQRSFVEGHLAWWLPAFAHAVFLKADGSEVALAGSYLAALARALSAWVPLERAVLGIAPPTELAAPHPVEADELTCAGSCYGSDAGS